MNEALSCPLNLLRTTVLSSIEELTFESHCGSKPRTDVHNYLNISSKQNMLLQQNLRLFKSAPSQTRKGKAITSSMYGRRRRKLICDNTSVLCDDPWYIRSCLNATRFLPVALMEVETEASIVFLFYSILFYSILFYSILFFSRATTMKSGTIYGSM